MQRRFKNFFIRDKKVLYMILGIVLFSVFSLTIVYAALSVTLNIVGNSEVIASSWDIHLDNVKVRSGSVSANAPEISDSSSVGFDVELNMPGDYYEFTVDVVNEGSIDAMIDGVVKTPELTADQAKYIKYEVSYENGESISTKQTLKKGTSTPIKVRIEYRKDILSSDLPSTSTELNLKLTLIYVQSDGTGSEVFNNGKAVRIISGDGTKEGNEVCIKEECFYVISSDETSVTLLSKYNLYVGGEYNSSWVAYGNEATGKQDLNMKGWVLAGQPYKGTTKYSKTNYWYSSGLKAEYGKKYPAYVYDSNSSAYTYVENYKTYLSTLGAIISEARLITSEELTALGCGDSSCSDAPSWVYTTSYLTGSARDAYLMLNVRGDGNLGNNRYDYARDFGVRPVIVIDKDQIVYIKTDMMEFTIDGVTYQAEDGMTWGEWIDSEYNTIGLSFDNDGYVYNGDKQLEQCAESSDLINSSVAYIFINNGLACTTF